MKICLLTQDGMTKIVEHTSNSDYYEEMFFTDHIDKFKASTKCDEGVEYCKTERRIFTKTLILQSGLPVFIGDK